MDGILRKDFPTEDADSSIDISATDINPDNSVSYQTADEGNSRYFSVIENDSTLEGINDISLQADSEQDTLTESRQENSLLDTSLINTSPRAENVLSSLSNISMDAVNKYNLNNIESTNILSGGVDIFDDNESSVDGHELVIDDDPQPSEKSDDCPDSTDMQYKYDDNATENDMQKSTVNFSMLKKNDAEESETVNDSPEVNGVESDNSQLESFKILENSEEIYGNFPEGSHAVNLLIDGNNVEAINIGKDVYIYTGSNGIMTAFQVLKEDGDCTIKYLQVEKNEEGNLVVYEEQVKEITDCNDDNDSTKDKDGTIIEKEASPEEISKQQKIMSDLEKNSQSLIKAVLGQEKKTQMQSEKNSIDDSKLLSDVSSMDVNEVQIKKEEIPYKQAIREDSSLNENVDKLTIDKELNQNNSERKSIEKTDIQIINDNSVESDIITDDWIDDHNTSNLVIDASESELSNECSSKNAADAEILVLTDSDSVTIVSDLIVKSDDDNAKDGKEIGDAIDDKILADSKDINKSDVENSFFSSSVKSLIAKKIEPSDVEGEVKNSPSNEVNILAKSNEESNVSTKIDDIKSSCLITDKENAKNDLDDKNKILSTMNVQKHNDVSSETKICDNTHSSLDSDDEFGDEYIGEPVTGDSEINWIDGKQNTVNVSEEKVVPVLNELIIEEEAEAIVSEKEVVDVIYVQETALKESTVEKDSSINGDIILESKICVLPEEMSLIDAQILVSSDEMKGTENDIVSDKITLHSFEDTVVKSVNIKVKLQNDHENSLLDDPIFKDNVNSEIGKKTEIDVMSVNTNVNRNYNSNIKSYAGKKTKLASLRAESPKKLASEDLPIFGTGKLEIVEEVIPENSVIENITQFPSLLSNVIIENTVKNTENEDSSNVIYDIFKVVPVANEDDDDMDDDLSENHILVIHEEESDQNDVSPIKTLDNIVADAAVSNEQSPRNKSRQPRKQIFTKVPSSDIEMIFSNTKTEAKLISPRATKSYSKTKPNLKPESTQPKNKKKPEKEKEQNESLIGNNNTNIKTCDDSSKLNKESSITVNETAAKNIDIKDKSDDVDTDNDVSFKSIDNESVVSLKIDDTNKEEIVKNDDSKDVSSKSIDTDNDLSFKSTHTTNDSPAKNKDTTPALSNSAKRKRGRPKKLISPVSNTFESVILNVDGSVIKPTMESPEKNMAISELNDKKESCLIENKKVVEVDVKKTNDTDNEDESEITSPSESGKRRKGRPKKMIEITEASPNSSIKSDVNMNDSSKLLFDDNLNENICPICSKNFRSRNVLLKHAKHCNGIISVDIIKSPKRRKIFVTDENTAVELVIDESEAEKESIVPSSKNDDENNVIINSDVDDKKDSIADTSLSMSTVLIEDSICEKSIEIESDAEKCETQDQSIITDVSAEENKSCDVIEENSKTEHSLDSLEKIVKLPLKIVRKREVRSNLASPMSRLKKILNTKSSENKVIKCEICNKVFRQSAHMILHRKKHDVQKPPSNPVESTSNPNIKPQEDDQKEAPKPVESDSMLKCDICKKGFRKLHHLVEHREVHLNAEVKSRRASVASVKSESEAGFRCDTCDKSFRKLHHLVEHRELHAAELNEKLAKDALEAKPDVASSDATCSGCGKSFRKRYHMLEHRDIHCSPGKIRKLGDSTTRRNTTRLSITSSTSEDSNNCDICGKSYRKLHHMVEHREVHADSSLKSTDDNKISSRIPVPDVLNTKDIIHECSRCYMVFPNINSLNKHMGNCLNKKILRKSTVAGDGVANKQALNSDAKTSINKSLDMQKNKVVKIDERKSVESRTSERKREILKPQSSVPKIAKITQTKPSEIKLKKPDKSISEETKVKYKLNSDYHFKYKINPAFKASARLSQSGSPKASPKAIANPKIPKSETSLLTLKKNPIKILDTISEETSFRYSFPKSPKQSADKEDESTLSNIKKVKDKIVTMRKSLVANTSKRKSSALNEPKLVAKRKSIGGRKSLGRKSLDVKALPKIKSKLQLKCCNKVFETQASLAVHRKTHNESRKSHKCDCGKQFSNDVLLKRHMDTEHTPPKSFKCQDCGVSVRTAAQFAKHKKTHDGDGAVFVQPAPSKAKNSPRNIMKTVVDKSSNQAKNKVKKSTVTTTTSPPPPSSTRKRRSAHGGVPLSEKMRKALAGVNF